MSSAQKNFGVILLQIALALFLVVSGIAVLQGGNGGDVGVAVNSVIKGDIARIVVYAIGVCELLAGVFLIIRFFMPTGNLADILLLIIIIAWIVIVVLLDILGRGGLLDGAFRSFNSIIAFFRNLSSHLLVLGALLIVKSG